MIVDEGEQLIFFFISTAVNSVYFISQYFFKEVPKCVTGQKAISTQHIYLTDPEKLMCTAPWARDNCGRARDKCTKARVAHIIVFNPPLFHETWINGKKNDICLAPIHLLFQSNNFTKRIGGIIAQIVFVNQSWKKVKQVKQVPFWGNLGWA